MSHSSALPFTFSALTWKNQPVESASEDDRQLSITAGAGTDWFADPSGLTIKHNAPVALFVPADPTFHLQARVMPEFAATFDAGVLFVYASDDLWAKLCFEYSPQQQPMIVSVVTRGLSDDCNSLVVGNHSVYLRLYRHEPVFAFHYSLDGNYWHLIRHFTLGNLHQLSVGFSAQSPTGQGCRAVFSEIRYTPGMLSNLRNGE